MIGQCTECEGYQDQVDRLQKWQKRSEDLCHEINALYVRVNDLCMRAERAERLANAHAETRVNLTRLVQAERALADELAEAIQIVRSNHGPLDPLLGVVLRKWMEARR